MSTPTKTPVHLALCCDRNVVDGLVTTIASAAAHLGSDFALDIHVIDCGLGPEIRGRVTGMINDQLPTARIGFIELAPERLNVFPQPVGLADITIATYARLLLHELLPEVERTVYLDCDLLVTGDLAELYFTPLNGAAIAAGRDHVILTVGHERESLMKEISGLRPDEPYFNAGVLLLDLQKLRAMGASKLYADALRGAKTRFADQSVLNAVFHGQWLCLSKRWNRQVNLGVDFTVYPDQPRATWHFSSKLKPWHFHARSTRGLLRQWRTERDAIGWTPLYQPTIQCRSPLFKDIVKQSRSWLQCRTNQT